MIKLTIADISVTLNKFLSNDYPRITVEPLTTVEYSAFGNPALSGTYYQAKYLWSVNAAISPKEKELLEIIWDESERRRRNLEDPDIVIHDYSSTIKEKTRTRQLVPGTSEAIINGNYVSYYAQFKGVIVSQIKFSKLGIVDSVNFSLAETVKVSA